MAIHEMKIENVSKSFHRKKALQGVTCSLKSGTYGLLGPNGAGKTTLMRCITGYYTHKGSVEIDGTQAKKLSPAEIGYLPQKFEGYPELTIRQMLEYFCNLKKIPSKDRSARIQKCLENTNLLEQERKKIKTLSGGMIRRLGIAQAILGDASVVLLDEPTAGLDPEERMRFKNVIQNITEDRIVIISTHIVEDVEACCDNILVMKEGQLLFADSIQKLRNYAQGRVLELREEEFVSYPGVYVEKNYLKEEETVYRVIAEDLVEGAVKPTIEDGYLCLLKREVFGSNGLV